MKILKIRNIFKLYICLAAFSVVFVIKSSGEYFIFQNIVRAMEPGAESGEYIKHKENADIKNIVEKIETLKPYSYICDIRIKIKEPLEKLIKSLDEKIQSYKNKEELKEELELYRNKSEFCFYFVENIIEKITRRCKYCKCIYRKTEQNF